MSFRPAGNIDLIQQCSTGGRRLMTPLECNASDLEKDPLNQASGS